MLFCQSKKGQQLDDFFFFFDFLCDHHARNVCADFALCEKMQGKIPTTHHQHLDQPTKPLLSDCAHTPAHIESGKDEEISHNISAFNIESMEHFHSREFFFFRIGCTAPSEGGENLLQTFSSVFSRARKDKVDLKNALRRVVLTSKYSLS